MCSGGLRVCAFGGLEVGPAFGGLGVCPFGCLEVCAFGCLGVCAFGLGVGVCAFGWPQSLAWEFGSDWLRGISVGE